MDVTINGSPQPVMDQEIRYAADAGLNYWAFLLYAEQNSMSVALKKYLASSQRDRLGFCVILHGNMGVSPKDWPAERNRLIGLLKERGYQKVLDGRPLVFAFGIGSSAGESGNRLADFRTVARDAGLNPYLVYMGWNPPADYAEQSRNGFDAVSAYAQPGDVATFAELARGLENGPWQRALQAKVPYVPLVTTGWQKQPRKDHPVSWEKDAAYQHQAVFPAIATAAEIGAHLGRGLVFVNEHTDVCPARTLLIYAWNEHDEGGWLSPTWTREGPNTDRLDAIHRVLRPPMSNAQSHR